MGAYGPTARRWLCGALIPYMTFLDGCRHLHRADHPDHGRRDRRGTELTAAGARLLAEAPRLLAASTAMVRAVTAAAAETPRFTIGFMPGITVTPAVRALASRHPGLDVRLLRTAGRTRSRCRTTAEPASESENDGPTATADPSAPPVRGP